MARNTRRDQPIEFNLLERIAFTSFVFVVAFASAIVAATLRPPRTLLDAAIGGVAIGLMIAAVLGFVILVVAKAVLWLVVRRDARRRAAAIALATPAADPDDGFDDDLDDVFARATPPRYDLPEGLPPEALGLLERKDRGV